MILVLLLCQLILQSAKTSAAGTVVGPAIRPVDDVACNAASRPRLVDMGDTITSPNYPSAYPPNAWCEWLCTPTTEGLLPGFTVTEFSLDASLDCAEDSVEVYDGVSAESGILLARFCGAAWHPNPLIGASGSVFIRFRSNGADEMAPGFRGTFSDGGTMACGLNAPQILTSPSGTFTSPGYPGPYDDSLRCSWLIQAQPGQVIDLNINALNLEVNCCMCDYIEIFDGDSAISPSFGRFCTLLLVPPIVSTGHHLFFAFVTDISIQGTGFSASYNTAAK